MSTSTDIKRRNLSATMLSLKPWPGTKHSTMIETFHLYARTFDHSRNSKTQKLKNRSRRKKEPGIAARPLKGFYPYICKRSL